MLVLAFVFWRGVGRGPSRSAMCFMFLNEMLVVDPRYRRCGFRVLGWGDHGPLEVGSGLRIVGRGDDHGPLRSAMGFALLDKKLVADPRYQRRASCFAVRD